MEKLTVIAFKGKDGAADFLIKKSTRKPGWSSIMVMTTKLVVSNGIIDTVKRIGFLRAKDAQIAALNPQLGEDMNVKLVALGSKPMRIQVKESLTPSYEGQKAKINPTTKEVIKSLNGAPIFYETEVCYDEAGNEDQLIEALKSTVAVGQEAGEVK